MKSEPREASTASGFSGRLTAADEFAVGLAAAEDASDDAVLGGGPLGATEAVTSEAEVVAGIAAVKGTIDAAPLGAVAAAELSVTIKAMLTCALADG